MSNSFNYHLHDMIFVNCFSRNLFIYFHCWMVVTKETILRMRAAVGSWYLIWTRTKPNFLPRAVCCHPMVSTCFTSVLINTQHNTPKHTHVMTFLHPLFVIWSLLMLWNAATHSLHPVNNIFVKFILTVNIGNYDQFIRHACSPQWHIF